MKTTKKFIVLLVVLAMLAVAIPAAFAAGTGTGSYEAGSTVEVKFEYANEKGVDGTLSFSNPGLFKEDVKNLDAVLSGNGFGAYNKTEMHWAIAGAQPTTFGISFKLTIKADAKPGDTCVITHTYKVNKTDNSGMSEAKTETVTITVKAKPQPTQPKPTQPTQPAPVIDYTEMNKQIDIAEGLDEKLYTKESWATLQNALNKANSLANSKDQTAVDAAAEALKKAIAGLVEMDYSALLEAIAKVEDLCEKDGVADLFKQLYDEVARGKDLLSSGDQKAVNDCAAKILELLAQVVAKLEELNEVETVIVEKPVEVPVLPDGPFCNIDMHKVWPILFWISLALNAGFIILIVVFVVKKKKNQKDNTPLVDYDINDDAADET